jgi:hypothetical protein
MFIASGACGMERGSVSMDREAQGNDVPTDMERCAWPFRGVCTPCRAASTWPTAWIGGTASSACRMLHEHRLAQDKKRLHAGKRLHFRSASSAKACCWRLPGVSRFVDGKPSILAQDVWVR